MTKFKWRVEFELEVDEPIVADGFNLTEERATRMLMTMAARELLWIPKGAEVVVSNVKILSAPSLEAIEEISIWPRRDPK